MNPFFLHTLDSLCFRRVLSVNPNWGSIIHLKLTKIQTLLKMDYCSACLVVLLLCGSENLIPFSAQLFVCGYRAVYACVFLFECIFPIDSLLFFLSNGFMP